MVEKKFALTLLVLGCASSVPSELPPTSPASDRAQPAPVSSVGVALREDPSEGWVGLPAATGMPMEHGGMDKPMSTDGGMTHHAH